MRDEDGCEQVVEIFADIGEESTCLEKKADKRQ